MRLGLKRGAVYAWLERNSIPGEWDLDLLRVAREEGVPLTLEELAVARSVRRANLRSPGAQRRHKNEQTQGAG